MKLGQALVGAGGTAALAAFFTVSGLGGVIPSLLAAAWLVAIPVLAVLGEPPPADEIRTDRAAVYKGSTVLLVVAGLLAVWALVRLPHSAASLLLTWPPGIAGLLGPALLLTAAGVLVAYGFRALSRRFGWQETEAVRAIMPETRREKGAFAALSFAAGFSEEIVFRAFLPAFLLPWTGSYLAGALPAAGVFGFLHAYQGRLGIVRTTVIGVVMAAGVAWTGSVWPAVFAHVALDLLFGLVLARSLMGEPRAGAAGEGASWT